MTCIIKASVPPLMEQSGMVSFYTPVWSWKSSGRCEEGRESEDLVLPFLLNQHIQSSISALFIVERIKKKDGNNSQTNKFGYFFFPFFCQRCIRLKAL